LINDAENPEWTDAMFAKAKRNSAASKMGRPKATIIKQKKLQKCSIKFFKSLITKYFFK